jgi:uncharacterized RDD family membrane protein YckC
MSVENPFEAESQRTRAATYFDPEVLDTSEQEFSASLESEPVPAEFVVDELENSAIPAAAHIAEIAQDVAKIAGPHDESAAAEFQSTVEADDASSDSINRDASPDWREQITAKISSYKSRSHHKPRYPSLQLPFEASSYRPHQRTEASPSPTISFSQAVAAEIVALQPNTISEPEPGISLEATARVLEFPRPVPPVFDPDELAESIIDRPRIVEAPELLPPPPAMGGILIEPPRPPEPERRPGFDMPLQSASLGRRVWAGSIDTLLLAIAVAVFGYVFVRVTGTLPPWRTSAQLAATLLALFWPAYEYAFLVFSEMTPGLRLAKLQVTRFDGRAPSRSLRRWRVLASFLSAASLGLGYGWCFLDEDQLSWHDRITKTHLAPFGAHVSSSMPSA